MRDPKYGWWMTTTQRYSVELPRADALRCKALSKPVSAFISNAKQSLALAEFPWMIANLGKRYALAEIAASMIKFGDPCYEGIEQRLPGQPNVNPEWKIEFDSWKKIFDGVLDGTVTPPFQLPPPLSPGVITVRGSLTEVGDEIGAVYDTMMSSQLILSWSAFETLAGDLWEEAVNAHPRILANMRAGVRANTRGTQESKTLPMRFLEMHGYDIKNKMGTILIEHRGPFQTLDKIADAYQSTFPRGACSASSPEFWKNPDVRSACAIRNLIIHQAGVIDEDFSKQHRGDPRLSGYKPGERFALDGELMRKILPGLYLFAGELIRSVDTWIHD